MSAERLVPSDDRNAYARWVRRQRAYGRWEPFTDAAPARAHLLHLMATTGAGWRQLADRAGVPRSTLTYLLYGNNGRRATRITPENARRILTLRADHAYGTTVPGVGTVRRIRVLMGEGWPQFHLGAHFGTNPRYVNQLSRADRVTPATAETVADAYQRLRGVDPSTCGVTPKGMAVAKRIARSNGWPDRAFWEDYDRIDDPGFDEAAAEGELSRDELAALRRADIAHLADCGLTPETIHQRMGGEVALSTIRAIVAEHRTGVRRDRKKVAA